VISFVLVILRLAADLVGLAVLAIRPMRSVEAENLVLPRQLAPYKSLNLRPSRYEAELSI
jgi:hypothetical protein